MATIKDIARLAGVSRGTVDRVLNKRGSVNPETEAKILEIVKSLEYKPNLTGKTLAVRKKQLKFGFILFSSTSSNPFFLDVIRGVEAKKELLKEYGVLVEVRFAEIGNPKLQVDLINELLEEGIDGLAIAPINHPLVRDKLVELTESGFPVVTTNSDIPGCGRLAYVGSDHHKSGITAAGLVGLVGLDPIEVGIVMGSPLVDGHKIRVHAFKNHIKEQYPIIRVVDTVVNNDDDLESFAVTQKLLKTYPNVNALYLAAGGVDGACKAVRMVASKRKIQIISNDATETIRKHMFNGEITATISQEPEVQGEKPLEILLYYCGMGIFPEKEYYFTKNEIHIKENL